MSLRSQLGRLRANAGPPPADPVTNGSAHTQPTGFGQPAPVTASPRHPETESGRRSRPPRQGLGRSIRLFRLFLLEQTQPQAFYSGLAADSVDQVARHIDLRGQTVIDVGGGAGYFTSAFRGRGANCYLFEPDPAEMLSRGEPASGAVQADGYWLPVADASADVVFSSNVLEHVADPLGFLEEMIRATRPGGLIYLSFTNWYSPWGGHEMSPWHLLGADYAARRYVRRYHREPKHHLGRNLFRVHVGPTLRSVRARSDVEIIEALPRYYPRWCRVVLWVPGLRELASWNLLLILRRKM
jgi:SAM-dependent methyltransferase